FDCDQLIVEFEDVSEDAADIKMAQDWWILQDLVDAFPHGLGADKPRPGGNRFSKEPAYILATGNAVALTSEMDPATGRLKGRARIAGPKLSVNLRPEVSKMLIEGPGNLLLEDNHPVTTRNDESGRGAGGLFGIDEDSGPSNTLIEWDELMWYDFSIDQTRFEGNVNLKYFSGAQLARIRGQPIGNSAEVPSGRSTFLTCDVLTVDFLDRNESYGRPDDSRMGRLSADQLRQFQASGSVMLQDQAEGLWLTAEDVIYEQQRKILVIHGTPQRKAHIITQKPGQLPNRVTVERLFYNLATGRVELSSPTLNAR
ncbi:MAG: hypothetical protein WBE26_03755, partial [Phycisphaerae bacterium]